MSQVRAASDLKALAHLIPNTSRLVLDPGVAPGKAAAAAGGNGNGSNSSNSSSSEEYMEVPTSSVRPGDILRVLPGERIPCDAKVVLGTAALDEALLTGESALVTKTAGERRGGG